MTDEATQPTTDEMSGVGVDSTGDDLHAALEAVLAVSQEGGEYAHVVQAIAERLVADLELARIRLFVLTSEQAQAPYTHLEVLATAGSHATFTREMPLVPLDGSTDVSRVAESGDAEFHGDLHGLGEQPEGGHVGLGRWRAAVVSQASAVLPLTVRDGLLGVLALEWSVPRAFDDGERAELAAITAAIALVLSSFITQEKTAFPQPAAVGCTPGPTAELAVTADGLVVPAGVPAHWAASPALELEVGAGVSGAETEEVFWDAAGLRDGIVMISLGLVLVPQGSASEVAETARHMLRASALQGAGPARSLGLLAGWLAATGPGAAWVSALVLKVNVRTSLLSWAAAGSSALAVRLDDGRFSLDVTTTAPLGATTVPDIEEHDRFVLPGDRCVLACGDVADFTTLNGMAGLDAALGGGAKAESFLEMLHLPLSAGGAIVMRAHSARARDSRAPRQAPATP
jgi:hypothetical protein